MSANDTNFILLNREGRWAGHHQEGLDLGADGTLTLASLPAGDPSSTADVRDLPPPDGPSGVAIDIDGTIYFADAPRNRLVRIRGCDGVTETVPCVGGPGCSPTQFNTPRGLLRHPTRRSLLVADSGNHRVQIFDLASGQLGEVWTGFDTPWTLAADAAGDVYVVDQGAAQVQKFDALGRGMPKFWSTLAAAGIVTAPVDIAVVSLVASDRSYVLIVDAAAHAVFVVDADGQPVRAADGTPVSFGADQLQTPLGIVAIPGTGTVLIGDNTRRRVLQFDVSVSGDVEAGVDPRDPNYPQDPHDPRYRYAGEAVGYDGPVAGLATDGRSSLLVHPGGSYPPVRLALTGGYRTEGVLWTDALSVPAGRVLWHRLQGRLRAPLAAQAHVQFFFFTASSKKDAPAPPALTGPAASAPGGARTSPNAGSSSTASGPSNPFTDPKWRPGPPDVADLFIGLEPPRPDAWLWIGAHLAGDGHATPALSQVRVEFDHDTYLGYLPAIYQTPGACRDLLLRFLSLIESFFGEEESAIRALPALFDPAATPRANLAWLAGWMGLALDEAWTDATARQAIADAFAGDNIRGTAAGLRRTLKAAGFDAVIEEPVQHAAWWALPAPAPTCSTPGGQATASSPDTSILGWTTMLAPAHPQGAVLGTSAVLDQSSLITSDQLGAPLFDDVASAFSVEVYRAQVATPDRLAHIRTLVEREKPAHTTWHLCVLEPRMRVGFQARVGIDAIVGGPAPSLLLGETSTLGTNAALAGPPAARVGEDTRVGVLTLAG